MNWKVQTAEASLPGSPPDPAEDRLLPRAAFPAVSVTARLVQMAERAVSRCRAPALAAGQAMTLVSVDLSYAAAPAGTAFRAMALLRATRGRLRYYEVSLRDAAGAVARARLTYAVVDAVRFTGLARRRAGRASMHLRV